MLKGKVCVEELIKVIQALEQRDWIDIVAIFSPIILSVVAIIISIQTTKKQNAIAMFDKKYNVVFQLKTILSFELGIEDTDDPKVILALFDSYYGTTTANSDAVEAVILASARLESVSKDLLMADVLFGEGHNKRIHELVCAFKDHVLHAASGTFDNQIYERFAEQSKYFRENELGKMYKSIKL